VTSAKPDADFLASTCHPLIDGSPPGAQGTPATFGGRWAARTAIAMIALATVLTFLPTLHNTFLPLGFDDGLILETPAIRTLTWANLRTVTTEFNRVNFIPVTMLSFAVQYAVSGLAPFGYHLVNILLHAAAAILVFAFLSPIAPSRRVALTAALLFALHPVQMASVSPAVERKTLLAGMFCLLALVAYQRWRTKGARRYYALALVAFLFGALSKAMAVSLPPVLVLYDYVFLGRPRWLEKLPFFGIAAVVSCAALAGHAQAAALAPLHGGNLLAHILIVGRANLEYVTSLFLPFNLAPVYYYPRTMVHEPLNVLAVGLIAFVCIYVTLYRRRYPWSFFCLWWFVLMLAPESNIVPLAQLRADRYLYLPSVGFALWVAVGLNRLPQSLDLGRSWHLPLRWSGLALAGTLAVLSYRSAGIWHDDVSAWARVVERHPWCAVAHGMLGRAYYDRNDDVQAERALRRALRFSKPPPDAYLYLAKLYAAHGLTVLASANLQRYLELAPDDREGRELLAALAPTGHS
jgi:protein O-mannosyl-transferase